MSLSVKSLVFGYPKGPKLIDGLDLEVRFGQSVAIMAPSGTGKTTLLALLGGLRKPDSGHVILGNEEFTNPRLSWVFQSMHLMPRRTVLDNVAVASLTLGLSRQEAELRASEQLERFAVGHLANRLQKDISGGESQRVALARAAVVEPQVVLADEPTANLDRSNVDMVSHTLFHGFPSSALIVTTHDQSVAAQAEALYVLENGRLKLA